MPQRIDLLVKGPTPFLDGPAEYICKAIAEEFTKVRQWKLVYGEEIDGYKRMDYGYRNLPALRFFNETSSKASDNGWITGDILCDSMLPASLRRDELQTVQDCVASALWQQFRRDAFFQTIRAAIPGLNELGRVLSVDKSLGYQFQESDEVVPLTRFTINFKLDLRIWDDYLTEQYRDSEDPFERTLKNLERISNTIRGVSGTTDTPAEVEIGADKQF
jgi:hypothetical protein